MFANGKDDWNETDVEKSGDERNRRNEVEVKEDERTLYWSSARVKETLRVF